jgi:hypothetical protein
MNKNNKFIFIFYLYIHTSLFFYFFTFYFSIFLFLFLFLFLFFGLGPAQPIWAGLDPASLARSLAKARDLAGLSPARVK